MLIILWIKTFSEQYIELFAVFGVALSSSWERTASLVIGHMSKIWCHNLPNMFVWIWGLKKKVIIAVALTAHQPSHHVVALHVLTQDFLLTTAVILRVNIFNEMKQNFIAKQNWLCIQKQALMTMCVCVCVGWVTFH